MRGFSSSAHTHWRFTAIRLTAVSGLTFERAWANRVDDVIEGVRVPVLGLADLIANKTAAGRDKDRADVKGVKGNN